MGEVVNTNFGARAPGAGALMGEVVDDVNFGDRPGRLTLPRAQARQRDLVARRLFDASTGEEALAALWLLDAYLREFGPAARSSLRADLDCFWQTAAFNPSWPQPRWVS